MPHLDRSNPNAFIGIILLVVLAVFVLPDRLPQFIGDLSPYLFSGIPCSRLPAAKDLAAHQSVLGRRAVDPLRLELETGAIGTDGKLVLRMSVSNESLGTVPIVYQENNIVIADADVSTDGLGIIIDPAPAEGVNERSDPIPRPMSKAISDSWDRARNAGMRSRSRRRRR